MSARKRGWFRHPRTTQELRANGRRGVLHFDEYSVFIRAKRSQKNLPTNYDDLFVDDCIWENYWYEKHICWKKYNRRNQYRTVEHGGKTGNERKENDYNKRHSH